MNYIISEELRDRLIANLEANAMADWYAFSCRDQAEKLRNLTPVQSGGVVTREVIEGGIISVKDHHDPESWERLIDLIFDLQLFQPHPSDIMEAMNALTEIANQDDVEMILDPTWAKRIALATIKTPTPQPEARGVDFMALPGIITAYYPFDALCRANEITSNDEKTAIAQAAVHAISKHLAHLQQAPQVVGIVESIKKTLEALRIRMSRLHHLDDGNIHLIALTIADNLPAPVKVADINTGDILCEKCNQPAVWCECPKDSVKVDDTRITPNTQDYLIKKGRELPTIEELYDYIEDAIAGRNTVIGTSIDVFKDFIEPAVLLGWNACHNTENSGVAPHLWPTVEQIISQGGRS